tara:strand:+ start:308 stop:685 length:378 start_codon:yes stop_codon:yes gene_type:complete
LKIEQLNKVSLSYDATSKIRTLKMRTGLTPNILCRFGIMLSLNEDGAPIVDEYDNDGMEFNRYTLFGGYEAMIIALIRERCNSDGLDVEEELAEQLRGHMNRGTALLYMRVRNILDLGNLVASSQ